MNFFYMAIGMAVNFLALVMLAMRFKLLLAYLHEKIGLVKALFATSAFHTLNYISPLKVDALLAKPLITKLFTKGSFRAPLAAFSFEFIFDLVLQIALFLLVIAPVSCGLVSSRTRILAVMLMSAVFASLLAIILLRKKISAILWQILPGKIKKSGLNENYMRKILEDIKLMSTNKKLLLKLMLLTSAYVLFMPLMLWASARSLSVALSYPVIFAGYWLSFIAGRFSGLPGGIGVRDMTLIGFLMLNNVPSATALKIAIIYRLIAIIPNLLIGVPVLVYTGCRGLLKLKRIDFSRIAEDVQSGEKSK